MKFIDRPVGSIILCDLVHIDRGKSNILGAGWTACPPELNTIQVFVVVNVPVEALSDETPLTIDVSVWERGDYLKAQGQPLASGKLEGTIGPSEQREVAGLMGSLALAVALEAQQEYLVVMSVNDEPTSFAPFVTTSALSPHQEAKID